MDAYLVYLERLQNLEIRAPLQDNDDPFRKWNCDKFVGRFRLSKLQVIDLINMIKKYCFFKQQKQPVPDAHSSAHGLEIFRHGKFSNHRRGLDEYASSNNMSHRP